MHLIHSQYSKRRFVVLEEALTANGLHILAMTEHELDYIIDIKPDGNVSLFEQMLERFGTHSCTEAEEKLADDRLSISQWPDAESNLYENTGEHA